MKVNIFKTIKNKLINLKEEAKYKALNKATSALKGLTSEDIEEQQKRIDEYYSNGGI